MKLHEIPSIKGSTHRRKRLGCGKGSGLGKTSGRGQKGAGARSGNSTRPGFEGGQMPLYRKLPRRGFNNKNFRTEYEIINVGDIDKLSLEDVSRATLEKAGAISKNKLPLKVLGHGEITRAVTVEAVKFSATARSKIEAAGGKVIDLVASSEPAEEAGETDA